MTTVAVAITSFNRRNTTLECLRCLAAQDTEAALQVFLTDDSSTDGTADAVKQGFPSVRVLHGDGNQFWTGGTATAIEAAMSTDPDYILWLNDDVVLLPNAIRTLVETARSAQHQAIVVGAVTAENNTDVSYGAFVSDSKWFPLKLQLLPLSTAPAEAETMNGNVVLVPREVAKAVGELDRRLPHNGADMDYGYRARRAGFVVMQAPGRVGACTPNRSKQRWKDPSVPFRERWRVVTSVKGFPPSGWLRFVRSYGGPFWPLVFCSPYARCAMARLSSPRTLLR